MPNSDVGIGIVSFSGMNTAKFWFVHTFALPSELTPIILGRGLKNPNFLNRTFSPEHTSLKIKKASGLLIVPISWSRWILYVITYKSGCEVHIPALLIPYSYRSTIHEFWGTLALHLHMEIASPSSQSKTSSCLYMLFIVISLYKITLLPDSYIFLQLCYSNDDFPELWLPINETVINFIRNY